MLENIKSSYFLQNCLSFLVEKRKLKLVKNNKTLQKEIRINLINYKLVSKRYIKFEGNRMAKEYNTSFGNLPKSI